MAKRAKRVGLISGAAAVASLGLLLGSAGVAAAAPPGQERILGQYGSLTECLLAKAAKTSQTGLTYRCVETNDRFFLVF